MPVSDAERSLAEQLRAGEESALARLIGEYGERMYRVAFSIVRSDDLAADVVQNAFVAAWERRDAIDPARGVLGYLVRLVRNDALDARRHVLAQARLHAHVAPLIPSTTINLGDEHLVAEELAAAARRAIDALQPRVREIFLLHREGGLSYAEIAETLGIAPATVHSQMSRALRQIARVLAERG